MCTEFDLKEHHTLFDEPLSLEQLLSELEDDKYSVAKTLHEAVLKAKKSANIVTRAQSVYERLLVCAGEIASMRHVEKSDHARATILDDLLRALTTEESGAAIVAAVKSVKEEARRLYEEYLKSQK
jgi:hypothetical protein